MNILTSLVKEPSITKLQNPLILMFHMFPPPDKQVATVLLSLCFTVSESNSCIFFSHLSFLYWFMCMLQCECHLFIFIIFIHCLWGVCISSLFYFILDVCVIPSHPIKAQNMVVDNTIFM